MISVPCLTTKPALDYINQGEFSSWFPRDSTLYSHIILAQHVRVYIAFVTQQFTVHVHDLKEQCNPPRLKWFTPSVPAARVFETKA